MYNSLFYYHPADVYKLYNRRIHVRWRVHRMWRVPQLTTLCTLVASDFLKYVRSCVFNSILYYLLADVYKLYKHIRWRVHRRWRVQQSTMLCTLVTTVHLKYIRDCVYNSTIYYLPADVYKLYKHVRWIVQWRWRVQQSKMFCTLVTVECLKYVRHCVQQYIPLSCSRRIQAVQTC